MKTKFTAKERWRKGYSQYRYMANILDKDCPPHLHQYANIMPAYYNWDHFSTKPLLWLSETFKEHPTPDNDRASIYKARLQANYIALSNNQIYGEDIY